MTMRVHGNAGSLSFNDHLVRPATLSSIAMFKIARVDKTRVSFESAA